MGVITTMLGTSTCWWDHGNIVRIHDGLLEMSGIFGTETIVEGVAAGPHDAPLWPERWPM